MPGEKAGWELQKDPASCFEQIQEAAPYETVGLWLHIYQVRWKKNILNTTEEASKLNILLWTPTHWLASISWPGKIHIHQVCVDTGCRLDDSPRVMTNKDWWKERVKGIHAVGTSWWSYW